MQTGTDGRKRCWDCKTYKTAKDFSKSKALKDGLNSRCKECIRIHDAIKYETYGPRQKEVNRIRKLKSFGLTQESFDAMLASQGHVCFLCGSVKTHGNGGKRFHIDHNHETGKVRALLCSKCNTGIGLMHDDYALLQKAAVYIKYRSESGIPIPDVAPIKITKGRKRTLKQYDLNQAAFVLILASQGGKCALCETTDPKGPGKVFCVDHSHVTGKVRGLLCNACNRAIGLLQDSEALLHKAAIYVKYRGI